MNYKIYKSILFLFLIICSVTYAQEESVYKISVDADPLVKEINGRQLPGKAQVRIVLTGRNGEVVGGKVANGIIPNITIDEEPNIGKVVGVELTLNGIGWTKSVTVRNVKVKKVTGDVTKTYNFPCGCPLTQGNQSVFIDAGGALDFKADVDAIRAEEMAEFEFDGEFQNGDVRHKNFTLSKRRNSTKKAKKGAPKVVKTKTRICTTQEYTASASFDTNFLTNPSQNAIYPGALIYAEDFSDGSYSNIPAIRAPIKLSTSSSIVGGSVVREVKEPSLSAIRNATNDIMINQTQGKKDLQVNFEIFEVSSQEELSLALGGYFENTSVTANVSFNYDTNSEKSLKVVKFAQIYYTMDVDQPYSPESVFLNPKDAIGVMNSGKTPLYVSTVTIGRIAYFFMETSLSSTDIQAHLDGEYRGSFTAGGSVDLENSINKEETKINALIIGGDGSEGIAAVNGYEGFIEMISGSGDLDPTSLGVPVSYTLRFLSDNSVARTNLATSYTKRTCKEVVNPIVKARFKGVSIESDHGERGFYGDYNVWIKYKGQNQKKLATQWMWNKDHAVRLRKDKAAVIDKVSEVFEVDVRKMEDYTVYIQFNAKEDDYWFGNKSETTTKNKSYALKDILSLDKSTAPKPDDPTAAAMQSQSLRFVLDEINYTFKFNVELF